VARSPGVAQSPGGPLAAARRGGVPAALRRQPSSGPVARSPDDPLGRSPGGSLAAALWLLEVCVMREIGSGNNYAASGKK